MACSICDENFKVFPVNCKSQHPICSSCLDIWMQGPKETQVTCPQCDEDITMHGKRVIWVASNKMVIEIPTLDVPCSRCRTREAEVFVDCRDCHQFCMACIKTELDGVDDADCPVCGDFITDYTYIDDIGHCNSALC